MAKDDGGPAYPVVVTSDNSDVKPGKSLRDDFAIAGLIALGPLFATGRLSTHTELAEAAYNVADAMIVAKKK